MVPSSKTSGPKNQQRTTIYKAIYKEATDQQEKTEEWLTCGERKGRVQRTWGEGG